VYAPPPVYVTLAGSASASLRVVAGLDTSDVLFGDDGPDLLAVT
jgi:hypothetical protein